jgi:DNA polymerase-3 subunit delta'
MPLAAFDATFPHLTAALRRARREDCLASAYLIAGDEPELREGFALALAQTALCPHAVDGEACGTCPVCHQLAVGTYPDLRILMPVSKSRQIVIGEDEFDPDTLRWFRAFFQLSSSGEGGGRVGIVHDADCLSHQSQNAFLKTLEEPPGRVLFLLVTGNPLALQPTIRSRCQHLPLLCRRRPYGFSGLGELRSLLRRLGGIAPDDLPAAVRAAEAMVALAGKLEAEADAATATLWEPRLVAVAEADSRIRKRVEDRHEAAARAAYLKLREIFLSCIHAWFAQVYLLSAGVDPAQLPNPEVLAGFDPASLILPEDRAARRLHEAETLLRNLGWNVRDDLALTAFCLAVTRP